jgi:hypothetical protein
MMAQQLRWVRAWLMSSRREVVAALVLIVLVGIAAFAFITYPVGSRPTNFGPEWDCTYVGKGDPVCVKRPAATSGGPAPSAR